MSSTFEDFRAERQALHERVFPVLADRCRERGGRFQPIDLRWGVSEEAARDQRTMEICFEEIARCQRQTERPNFLALIGDRYGWRPAPAAIPVDEFQGILDALGGSPGARLIERWYRRDENAVPATYVLLPRGPVGTEEWSAVERELHDAVATGAADLRVDPSRRLVYEGSATHQEIHSGVFSVPDARGHAVCVLRTIEGLPSEAEAIHFVDTGPDGGPDEDARLRLGDLRDELRRRLPDTTIEYRETWSPEGATASHLDDLCASVETLLWSTIEVEFDAAAARDEVAEEADGHWSFAAARVAEAGGSHRDQAEARVLDYLAGESHAPLVLTGPGGVGKTTFAGQVAERLRSSAGFELFVRFVGVSAESSSAPALLASLAREAGRRYGLGEDVPGDYGALVSDLWARLDRPPAGRLTVLIVDGVDLLGGRAATQLDWLPARLPPRVRVLVAAAPGPTLEFLLGLPGRELVELELLARRDGGVILERWLAERGRTLQPAQRDHVLDRFAANGLPLYLRVAAEEAVRWRSDAPPAETLLGDDVAGIVGALLRRLSSESEHGPVLVKHSLAYVACSKSGLAEDELLAVLGADGAVTDDIRRRSPRSPATDELPTAVWARLLADLAPYLAQRRADGARLLGFFHRLFAEAVEEICVGSDRAQRHDDLARLFSAQPLESGVPNLRALAELPYQLAGAGRERDLAATLTDYTFLDTKLRAVGPQPLLDDFALPRGNGEAADVTVLDAVAGVLERAAALLAERPGELPSQLHGRLLDRDDAGVHALLAQTRRSVSNPWLRPLTRSLGIPGGPLVRTISTRGGDVQAVALTPDERRVLAACRDGSIEVWDLERGELTRTLRGHRVFATCVAVAPDGHVAVSGARARWGEEGMELRVWDLDQGRPLATFPGPEHDFGAIAVLPGGGRAAASSYDGTVRVWDLDTGAEVHRLTGHASHVRALSVTADARVVASGADDGTIRIWDLERGQALRVLELDHCLRASSPEELQPGATIGVSQVTGVAFSPDGGLLVSTSPQEGLCFWDVEDGTQLERLSVFADYPLITTNGRLLVVLSARAVEIWDLATRTRLGRTEEIAYLPTAAVMSGDGRIAVTGGGSVLSVWMLDRVVAGSPESGRPQDVTAVAVVAAGTSSVAVVATWDSLEGWSLETGERLWHNADGGALDLTAIPGSAAAVAGGLDGQVHVLDVRTGTEVALAEPTKSKDESGHEEDAFPAVHAVAVAPDGRAVAGAARKGIGIWNTDSGSLVARIDEPSHDPKALAMTPDGSILVSLADRGAYAGDHNLKRWDLATGRELAASPASLRRLRRLRRGPDLRSSGSSPHQTRSLAITPDGKLAVTALFGDGLRLWDLHGDDAPQTLDDGAQQEAVATLPQHRALAPEGYTSPRLLLWDLDGRRSVGALVGHAMSVSTLAVTPDGRRAVSAGGDLAVFLWDLRALEPLATFTLEDFPNVCALSADGEVAVVGDRRSLHLLRLEHCVEG